MTGETFTNDIDRTVAYYPGAIRDNGKPLHIPLSMPFTFEWYTLDDISYALRRRFDFPNGTGYVNGLLPDDPEAREWMAENPHP